jgi:hypothetical protein
LLNQDSPSETHPNLLPALPTELERVRLIVQIARRDHAVDAMRAKITAEEADQRLIQMQIDDRIGMLRRDHERMSTEIGRLETRLERLVFARRALSDVELDDEEQVERAEEAAFWAEWRQQREERRGTVINRRPAGDEDITLRQLYRALARLIHPDLATDPAERNRREAVMRMANAANEARDIDQLNRLLEIWSKPQDTSDVRDLGTLQARVAERDVKHAELERQLEALKQSALGKMIRRPKAELAKYIKREEERLRRKLATLRLKRRRLLTAVEDRRRELAEASD